MKKNKIAQRDMFATDHILRQVAPLPNQPIGQETGLIGGFFENWKLEQRAKSSALIRQIAEDQSATITAYAQSRMTMMTSSKQVQHTVDMMDLERQIKVEDLIERRLKNKKLHHEANQEEIAEKIKLKQFEELYGSPSSEDRD